MDIYYDPLDPRCKSITGAIQQNTVCVLTVFGKNDLPCELILQKDGEREQTLPMRRVGGGWRCELTFAEAGLYFYSFRIGGAVAGMGALRRLTFLNTPQKWQILVYRDGYKTPDWLKGGVMYQIFPDRFYKSGDVTVGRGKWLHKSWDEVPEYRANAQGKVLNNDFFGGNLKGIREKLGYLTSLGVTVLYLNPIFKAYSNHRYDTGDYMTIDPILGTEEDLAALLADCKARGIRVILDGVFNHTGDDSLYFNKYGNYKETGAYQSKDSKYYPWYTFRCFPDSPPTIAPASPNSAPPIKKPDREVPPFVLEKDTCWVPSPKCRTQASWGAPFARDTPNSTPSEQLNKDRRKISHQSSLATFLKIALTLHFEAFLSMKKTTLAFFPLFTRNFPVIVPWRESVFFISPMEANASQIFLQVSS